MVDGLQFVARGKVAVPVDQHVDVLAAPAAVFDAWSTAAGWRAMMDVDGRVELAVGGAFELLFDLDQPTGKQGSEECKVLCYVPDSMLAFSWNAPPEIPQTRGFYTWCVVTFEARGDGVTRVRLRHLGFGEGPAWEETVKYFQRAWGLVLKATAAHFGTAS